MEWKKLISLCRLAEKPKEPSDFDKYPISELEKDYQAIISSVAFRRLQDKTQVFPLDKSDFVRTRLTHSMEVSTIARQLGIMVTQNTSKYLQKDFSENEEVGKAVPVILSCAGLLHDLGNPPFGHFGETVIGEWFQNEFENPRFVFRDRPVKEILNEQMKQDLIHFEGNAQALRILSKIKNNQSGYDVNLSFGVLNTLIKYPTDSIHFNKKDQDIKRHKLGYFYSEREIAEKICEATGTFDKEFHRHPLVYLMEAADDIAYSTADLEDALQKGKFSIHEFLDYYNEETAKIQNKDHQKYTKILFEELVEQLTENGGTKEGNLVAFQKWMETVRKWFMYVASFGFSRSYEEIMKGEYRQDLFYQTNHQETIEILKGAMKRFVYDDTEILKLELSAKKILSSLMDDLVYAVLYLDEEPFQFGKTKTDQKLLHIISENYIEDYRHAKTDNETENLYLRFLIVTDFLSGMTDSYAKNLYQELNGL